MIIFLSISGVLLWLIIFSIIGFAIYEQYKEHRIKKAFERAEKRYLDMLFKDAMTSVVNKEINSNRGVVIKAGETVRVVPHDQFKREFRVMTYDYRYIEGVKPEFLDRRPDFNKVIYHGKKIKED